MTIGPFLFNRSVQFSPFFDGSRTGRQKKKVWRCGGEREKKKMRANLFFYFSHGSTARKHGGT